MKETQDMEMNRSTAILPFSIAYTIETIQDISQGILETQQMMDPEIIEARGDWKEDSITRFIRAIEKSNDTMVINGLASLIDVYPYYIPEWIINDPNIAPFIEKKQGYLIGFFENPSAPLFPYEYAYYNGKTLYYIQHQVWTRRLDGYGSGWPYINYSNVVYERIGTNMQHWDIPEERISDVIDLEKLGKEGWNLSAGVFPFLSK